MIRKNTNERHILLTNQKLTRIVGFFNFLKGNRKWSSTKDVIAIDIETYKKWNKLQMTTGMNWSSIEINLAKRISSFEVSKNKVMREAFNWVKTQTFFKKNSPA